MRSATTLAISIGGCGTAIVHCLAGSAVSILIGETAIMGTPSSLATVVIAIVPGAVAVPIRISTFSSSISLRALRVVAAGSEPSSSWITVTVSEPILLLYFCAAFIPLA